jgi:hypothetical protein
LRNADSSSGRIPLPISGYVITLREVRSEQSCEWAESPEVKDMGVESKDFIGFKKKILARLEGGIRVRRTGQYVVEGSDR